MPPDPERQARTAAILLEADESSNDYAFEDAMSPLWGLWLQRSNVVRSVRLKKPGGSIDELGQARRSWWGSVFFLLVAVASFVATDNLAVRMLGMFCVVLAMVTAGRNYWRDDRSVLLDPRQREMTVTRGKDTLVTVAFDDVDAIHLELTAVSAADKELRIIVTVGGAALPIATGARLEERRRLAGKIADAVGYRGDIDVRVA